MRIFIACPCHPFGVHHLTAVLHGGMVFTLMQQGHNVESSLTPGTFVDANHNFLTQYALDQGFDAVMWHDADMIFPVDAASRFLAHKKDIVGAAYRRRGAPHDIMGFHQNGERVSYRDKGLMRGTGFGAGLMLVRRGVYETMPYPWYENIYGANVDEFKGGDSVFLTKARDAKLDVFMDLDLSREVRHIGEESWGWNDLQPGEKETGYPNTKWLAHALQPKMEGE